LAERPELRARAEQAARRLLASVTVEDIAAAASSTLTGLVLEDRSSGGPCPRSGLCP
jgi:hypothetical protein